VQSRFGGSQKYYPARIDRAHADGTYDVEYDDGDHEIRVAAALIRLPPGSTTALNTLSLSFPELQPEPEPEPQREVEPHAIRDSRKIEVEPPAEPEPAQPDDGSGTYLCQGDKVEARFGGGNKYYPGVIERVQEDGTYNIGYEDGDRETHVEEAFIRLA
jgi:hypothetical protein